MSSEAKKDMILLITNIPTPYRIPLFNELDRQLACKDFKLKVVFGALGYPRRKWAIDMTECTFDYEVLSSRKITFGDPEKTIFTYPRLSRIIKRESPCLIIVSGFSVATTKLWLRSLFINTPYYIWSGTIHNMDMPDSFLRKTQRRLLIKRASGFISYGTRSRKYLISLGADPKKTGIAINTVDTEFFRENTKNKNQKECTDRKKSLLFIGHFVKRKRIDLLIQIVKTLSTKRNDFVLKLIGDGPEKENLKFLVQKLKVDDFVCFKGFKQKSELPKYFEETDCFIFQTGFDIWGLVLVEAMAAGLPCISSIFAGATHDLIKNGENGFIMDFSRCEEVAHRINWILNNPGLAREIGKRASLFIMENASIEKSANGFLEAIRKTLKFIKLGNCFWTEDKVI